jgi:hypothetical protein
MVCFNPIVHAVILEKSTSNLNLKTTMQVAINFNQRAKNP